jgi:hypothetical protein
MTPSNDRTIHATTNDGVQVVRHDRAGKWYAEQDRDPRRRCITVAEAIELACRPGSVVHYGLPGGSHFDREVRAAVGGEVVDTEQDARMDVMREVVAWLRAPRERNMSAGEAADELERQIEAGIA